MGLSVSTVAAQGPAPEAVADGVLDLADLDGSNGLMIEGVTSQDNSGCSVACAGDVNGDGFDDVIIGARNARIAGRSYVLFGKASTDAAGGIALAGLRGSDGFVLVGVDEGDDSGFAVASAGDFNGDGFDDLMIAAPRAYNEAEHVSGRHVGEIYVVFGGTTVGESGGIDLGDLNGEDGFAVLGLHRDGSFGLAISTAGDVNGDGFDDLLIGAPFVNSGGHVRVGAAYVILGGDSIGASGRFDLATLDGSNGFVLNGINSGDLFGVAVASAGDFNADGFDDVIIGATHVGNAGQGACYVVFGGEAVGAEGSVKMANLDFGEGFVVNGVYNFASVGQSVFSADVNGDGFDDLIVGGPSAYPNQAGNSGESYVVFGGESVGESGIFDLEELNGSNGFSIAGLDEQDHSGISVAGAGDMNGDGFDDLIIGALGADPNDQAVAGESYVVFGGSEIGASGRVDLAGLNGANGLVLNGIDAVDRSGCWVSGAGDFNGDGLGDVIIGAWSADPNGTIDAGESYVGFGFSN